jgi:hypothetical protein
VKGQHAAGPRSRTNRKIKHVADKLIDVHDQHFEELTEAEREAIAVVVDALDRLAAGGA